MVRRSMTGILVASVFLFVGALPGESRFYVTDRGAKMWEAPSGGWKLCGIGRERTDVIQWAIERKPPGVEELKGWEVMVREPGEWLAFGVKFGRVQRLVFTKHTKIVLIDTEGHRYESEACLFWPDEWQTQVYDARKMAVVVTNKTIYCRPLDGTACLKAKFARGSFQLKDIAEFEVVGAIEDTLQQGGGERR